MNVWNLAPAVAVVAALALPRPSLACEACGAPKTTHAAVTSAAAPSSAGKVVKGVRTIELSVTQDGFTPAEVKAKAGETVKLVVTRKVERTCATEIVMKDLGVNQPLPLGKAVAVTVKPPKAGSYRFACGMDMIAGQLVVE
jgi:plastocyanin domain-containing protein